jgi:signal transduction histidine kinase
LTQLYLLTVPAWRRALPVARILLALVCLAPNAVFGMAYLAIATFLLFWVAPARRPYMLGTLLIDTIFFLLAVFVLQIPETGLFGGLWILYLMTTAILLHTWREILVIAVCITALLIVRKPGEFELLLLSNTTLTVLALVSNWQRGRMEKRMYLVARKSVMARAEAIHAREAERERIAEDFHDGPLQSTISFQVRLEVLRRMLLKDPEKGMKELEQLQAMWKSQVAEMRAFVHSIRLAATVPTDLAAALKGIVDTFGKENNMAAAFSGTFGNELEPEKAIQVLHMTREALHNVRKHAEATRAEVRVEPEDGHIRITFADNGKGFSFQGSRNMDDMEREAIGPSSIKRRVRLLHGEMKIESQPGSGTRLQVRFPR